MKRKMNQTSLLSFFAALCLLVGVSDTEAGAQNQEQRVTRTLEIGPEGELSVSNIFGNIHVEATTGEQVTIEAVKRLHGDAEPALLDRVEIDINHTGRRVRIETRHQGGRGGGHHREHDSHGGVSIDYRVSVPVGTEIEIQTVSGDVTVRGVDGEARVGSVQGTVDVSDLRALASAKSVSGDVTVKRARSDDDVEISSVSGEVFVDDIAAEELTISSVSGDVRLVQASCEEGEFSTVSGDVRYTGRITKGGRYELKTHSGDIVMTIDDDVGFELEASTFSGDIESDFPMRLETEGRHRRNLEAVFGDGSANIEATTFSGDIELRKH